MKVLGVGGLGENLDGHDYESENITGITWALGFGYHFGFGLGIDFLW